ncbi:Mitochondrial carrier domain,Mitochondrial substrate/solute carrier [Cinara cedri]|uniref:Mitochondrial carrier domain,Mitochondrial substrate/solute carrier n=1 Tax=Cinara cedri TaxID=506608 RepID=A0A5E4MNB8_9HEMI|nr:Mitochondrial carrier domain,Mitochondrial substrate/solute carrier [Cinara cedri]
MNENELNLKNSLNSISISDSRHYSTSLIAGAIAGTTVDVALFPLDTLKTRLQSQYGFINSGGFSGIYKGLTPTIIGAPFTAGLFFGTYDGFKNLFPNVSNNTAPLVHLCAGIVGEVVCCTTKVPVEIVKQRRQASPNQESIIKIMKTAYNNEGFFGFYRGYWTTVMRDVPFSMLQLPIWEYLKKEYKIFTGKPLTPFEVAVCGSISGGIAAALTTPIDVTKTQIMLANSAVDQNFSTVFINIYKTKGIINGLFAGFLPRVICIMLGGALFFGAYEKTCRYIEDKKKNVI